MSYRRNRYRSDPVAARRRTMAVQGVVAAVALLVTGYLVVRALLMA
jgi:hypothetical protein